MAEKKIIELEVKTNIKGVNLDMKDVVKQTKEATVATQNLNQATAETGAKSSGLKAIKDTVVNLVPGLKSAEGGVNALGNSFKMLLANPIILIITAIVGALKFVYEAFQSNVKIGKEIAAVWEGLNAVGTQVKDAIFGLTRSLAYAVEAAYKFITLDFKGAGEAMKNANKEASTSFNQLSKAIDGTTFATIRKLEKEQQANNKAKKEQVVRQSEINKLLVQSREVLTDETESINAKKKALGEVTKAEKEFSKEKVRSAETDLRILQEKAKALGGQAEKKMKQEIRDATVALNEAETENAMTGIKLNKQRKMLLRQETEEGKAAVEEAKARAKERADAEKTRAKESEAALKEKLKQEQETEQAANQAKINARNNALSEIEQAENDAYNSKLTREQLEIQNVNDKYFKLIELAKEYGESTLVLEQTQADEVARIQKDAADKKAQLDKDVADKAESLRKENEAKETARVEKEKSREKDLRDRKIQMGQQAFGALADLSTLFAQGNEAEQRKAFQLSKAANLGLAIMNTANAVTGALAEPSIVPGERFFKAALAGATGGINIAKIAATQFQATGDTSTGTTPTASAPRTPSFDIIQAQPQMQLGALQQQPIKAYVVSGEVSTAQALDRNRVRNATF
jgi:hypothetical protein